jgi:DNA-3-methyladenine glycosylase
VKTKPIVVPPLDADNHSDQPLDRVSYQSANRVPDRSPYRAPLLFRRLRRSELPVATVALARFLVGKIVVRELQGGRVSGRIVETEAYPPRDPAAHHFRGPTPRNRTMYLRRGHAYVYFTYGNHFMLNVSAEATDVGGGILIRALEPLEGIGQMQRLRQTMELRDLTRGPGRLAEALEIDRRLDGIDLCAPGVLWLGELRGSPADGPISGSSPRGIGLGISVRIGITRAAERRLRFYERGNRFVSGPVGLNSGQRPHKLEP